MRRCRESIQNACVSQVDRTGANACCPCRRRVNLFNKLNHCIRTIDASVSKAPRHHYDIKCVNLIERVCCFNSQPSGVINHRTLFCRDKKHIEVRNIHQRLEWTNDVQRCELRVEDEADCCHTRQYKGCALQNLVGVEGLEPPTLSL